MKRSILTVLIVAALGFAAAAHARVATGTLAGTVLDAHGKPVAHATVTIQTSYGDHPNATHTDANGHFAFARYRTGQYDVRAYADGVFSDWTQRVLIRSHRTTEVTLRLPPAK
jgi:uncharacterized GH25 family protein